MTIELRILNKEFYNDNRLPNYATAGSAAVDLVATNEYIIPSMQTKMVQTGLAIHIGSGYTNVAGLIVPRSGIGNKGLILSNTIGLIDEDYQGELLVSVWNRNTEVEHLTIHKGQRFAQLLFVPIVRPEFKVVDEFSESTDRGIGGFGSSGR